MATEVEICNLALDHIRAAAITLLTGTDARSLACNRHYAVTRDAVLRDHAWGFAKKRKVLILVDEEFSGWGYTYLHPVDCIVAHKIYDLDGSLTGTVYDEETGTYVSAGKVEFEVSLGENLGTDITITGASQTSPVVITAAGHGLADDDKIIISDVVGMTELNGRTFIVDDSGATFSLDDSHAADVDGTDYTAYVSGGVINKLGSDRKYILTDQENAELIYTAQVTTTTLFDPMFVEALSYALAVKLAQPLKADKALKKELEQKYEYVVTRAKAVSANESYKKPDNSGNSYVDVR